MNNQLNKRIMICAIALVVIFAHGSKDERSSEADFTPLMARFQVTQRTPAENVIYLEQKSTDSVKLSINHKTKAIKILISQNISATELDVELNIALKKFVKNFGNQKELFLKVPNDFELSKNFFGALRLLLKNDHLFAQGVQLQDSKITVYFVIDTSEPMQCFSHLESLITLFAEPTNNFFDFFSNKLSIKRTQKLLDDMKKENTVAPINNEKNDRFIAEFNDILGQKERELHQQSTALLATSLLVEGYYAYTDYRKVGSLGNYLKQGLFLKLPQNRLAQIGRFATKFVIAERIWRLLKPGFDRFKEYFSKLSLWRLVR